MSSSNISLLAMAQIATLMISIAEALFFGYHLSINKWAEPIWEPFWVTVVEVTCYVIQLASNSYRFRLADGSLINVISPMAWMLACPVAMSFMMRISWPEVSHRVNIGLIMNLVAVLLLGMLSGMTANIPLKVTLFSLASVLYLVLCTFLLKGMFWSGTERPREAKNILLFFMGTWMLFPTVWLLGPNATGIWSYELTLTFFAFGDIFSKNIFTYIGFRYTQMILEGEGSDDEVKPVNATSTQMVLRADKVDFQPKSPIDPLMIARIIEHLEAGQTIRGTPESKLGQQQQRARSNSGSSLHKASSWDRLHPNGTAGAALHQQVQQQRALHAMSGQQQVSARPQQMFFPENFQLGNSMTGISKDTEQQVHFTITNSIVKTMASGTSVTHVAATNDVDASAIDFTVMRDDSGDVVFCDMFHEVDHAQFIDNSGQNGLMAPRLLSFLDDREKQAVGASTASSSSTASDTQAKLADARKWSMDHETKICMSQQCKSNPTGNGGAAFTTFLRRHHCRNCGGVYCDRCSQNKVPIVALRFTAPVRVCDSCHDSIKSTDNNSPMRINSNPTSPQNARVGA